ncbi:trypsin-like peptidase domain-containing protein [Microbacterium sp. zg.Y625]|uniref:S1C family serine protease n=1 Tax=Microbacterium jiangjiandongii TaxID=3049071 RepID=UPI00214BB553|nr:MULTISPECIES: trypsin-like peptidase domain-containing protein [unclassified Microbacterium]MCR2793084.1 trypsin-like peptidase domain-containing protein [Microbacterium sp. zg.Y625]WIM24194.1 trypsin-like peptidase domain-containing protein [Microbacterium sp. zg-Y625]
MSDTEGIRPTETPAGAEPAAVPPVPPQAAAQAAQQHPAPGQRPAPPHPGAPAYGAAPRYGAAASGYGAPQHPYGAAPQQPTAATAAPSSTSDAAESTSASKSGIGAGKVAALMLAAALVGGTAGIGGAYAGVNIWSASQPVTATGPASVTVNDTDSVNQTTAIAAKVVPSVVTIAADGGSAGGTGSGVILSEDGYVVTNTHVVTLDGATSDAALTVTTADGRVYDAEIVGLDPMYDLAVIKLQDASGLTPIEFADSADLNVGDEAVAVGAPLGLANTVTTGIVSALNRSISIASSAAPETPGDGTEPAPEEQDQGPFYFDFGQGEPQQATSTISISVLQTDAAINPGNSGGALVDAEGKLIGINVAIATAGSSSESGSIGVGFAIPSDIVERITDEIIEDGAATHGLLGAMVAPAASIEGATTTGAYIDEVTPGGAAAEAGLQQGDIVTGFDGLPITSATDLTAQVRAVAGGSTVSLTYLRDGETRTTDVTLGELVD